MIINTKTVNSLAPVVLGALASLTVLLLTSIFLFLFLTGSQAFTKLSVSDFLGPTWNPTAYRTPSWGIGSLLTGTLMVSGLSLLIAIPCGLAIAIYLAEIATPKSREILKPLIEMIASVPSVVLGFLGLVYLSPLVARLLNQPNGLNALTASLLVAVTALPTIASLCEDALSSVARSYRQASFALAATHWQTITRVVIPAARPGIVAGIMLGLGRVVGETMIVLMVAGNSRAFPTSFLSPVSPITSTIAIDIKEVVVGGLHWQALFALGCLLFVLTFLINLVVDILTHQKENI